MIFPVAMRVEPGKSLLEGGVVPAAGKPGRIMHDAQAAQRLDEMQLAGIEVAESSVPLEQGIELWNLLRPVSGEEHPEILHGRAAARVVKIDDMQLLAGNQHVAGMKVPVDAELRYVAGPIKRSLDTVDDVLRDALIGGQEFHRNEVLFEQEVH